MISVRLKGGLGNQLFQIFTLISLSLYYKIPFILLNHKQLGNGENGSTIRYTYWDSIFDNLNKYLINVDNLENFFSFGFYETSFNYDNNFINSLNKFLKLNKFSNTINNNNKNILIVGYFQSFKYFENYKNSIIDLLKLNNKRNNLIKKIIYEPHLYHNIYNLNENNHETNDENNDENNDEINDENNDETNIINEKNVSISILNNLQFNKLNIIKIQNSISLHFRLGDYKKFSHQHPILTLDYYINSLNYITNLINNDIINNKLFSNNIYYFCEDNEEDLIIINDNIKILKNNFPYLNFIKVSNNLTDWEQLLFMSFMKYNIIANSTFSWWGAYLNQNKNKIITYPSLWFSNELNKNTDDLFPTNWIKI